MSTTDNQDVLDTLTPEERAAISDTEYSPEELAAMKGLAEEGIGDDDDDENDDATGGEDGNNAAGAAPIEGAGAGDADPAAATGGDETGAEDEPAPAEPKASAYRAVLPEDYDAQVKTLNEETSALGQKFRAGEIEFEDYETQQAALLQRRDDLREIKIKAEIASEMGAQSAENEWMATVNSFVSATAKAEGINYATDTEKQADLDLFVKRLAESSANNDKPMRWFLEEAHKRVKALHGIATPEKKQDDQVSPKPLQRKAPTEAIPKTLAQVPGSDGPGDVADEFANLDNLEGLELEDALRKMTPEQRERYAMAGR